MSTLQKLNSTQPATSYQRNSVKTKSVGAASVKSGRPGSVKPTSDRYEALSVRSGVSGDGSDVNTSAKRPRSGRRVVVATAGLATGAAVLGFAGYGIYAAAPHIAAGVTAAFAVPAVHFVAIGVGVGLALALVGVGVYAAVKKYKAYKASRALDDGFSVTSSQKRGPRQLSAENVAKVPSPIKDSDSLTNWVQDSSEKAETPTEPKPILNNAPVVQPTPKKTANKSIASGLADALKALKDDQERTVAAPAAKTQKNVRIAVDAKQIRAEAEANWNQLAARFPDMQPDHVKGWKSYYADQISAYTAASTSAEANKIFADLQATEDAQNVFPELQSKEAFDAALPGLKIKAESWARVSSGR